MSKKTEGPTCQPVKELAVGTIAESDVFVRFAFPEDGNEKKDNQVYYALTKIQALELSQLLYNTLENLLAADEKRQRH